MNSVCRRCVLPLPQYSRGLQWDCHAIAAGYQSRRVVRGRAGSWNVRAIDVTGGRARQVTHVFHLMADRVVTFSSFGIQLNPHRIRVKVLEKYLDVKGVLPIPRFNLDFSEAEPPPFLFQGMPPFPIVTIRHLADATA